MKKITSLIAIMMLLSVTTTSCNQKSTLRTLTIYNWQDYIFEGSDEVAGVVEQFEEYYYATYQEKIKVNYYTFETNENMLNILKTGKSNYDLVCPSDYTIQKMISEGMAQPLDVSKISNYTDYGSPYMKEVFETNKTYNEKKELVSWSDYSIPYMWGTMGFMYNPEIFDGVEKLEEEVETWDILWNEKYKGRGTLKDSVRDTYCAGVLKVYQDELNELAQSYENELITASEYMKKVSEIMNRADDETISKVEKALKSAKENIYGFEVDSGKSDIVTGKIDINFCWSGDAVYAMDCAEEESGYFLNYVVPKEGSNIWFDGWVIPNNAKEVDLAHEFLNFLCDPVIACLNMEEVGYTSAIAGEEIFELVNDWYAPSSREDYSDEEWEELSLEEQEEVNENDKIFASETSLQEALENEELYVTDLTYFFGDTIEEPALVYYFEKNRQLNAQYPEYEVVIRCGVMEEFGEANDKVLDMWSRVKSDDVPVWAWVIITIVIFVVAFYLISSYTTRKIRTDRLKAKKIN